MSKNKLKNIYIFIIVCLFIGTEIMPLVSSTNNKKNTTNISQQNYWIVDKNGYGDFIEIQLAIDNADDGDTIIVYNPNPTSDHYEGDISINKKVVLIGNETNYNTGVTIGKPTINASFLNFTNVINILVDDVTISGFNITGSGQNFYWTHQVKGYRCDGISIDDNIGGITISDNNIFNNGNGIRVKSSKKEFSGIYIYHNEIIDNLDNGIIFTYLSSGVTVEDNVISNNGEPEYLQNLSWNVNQGDGIEFHSATVGSQILNNEITGNCCDGIWIEDSMRHRISDNFISNNILGSGIHVEASNSLTISYNEISNHDNLAFLPGFFQSPCCGINIKGGADNSIEHNNFHHNTYGIHLFEAGNSNLVDNTIIDNSIGLWVSNVGSLKIYDSDFNNKITSIVLLYCSNGMGHNNSIEGTNLILFIAKNCQFDMSLNWWGNSILGPTLRTIRIPTGVIVRPFLREKP